MSRLTSVLTLCVAVLCVTGLTGQQKAAAPDSNVILLREQQRVKYLVSGDIDGLAQMTSPTLSYSHSNGSIDEREKYLNDLRIRQVVFRSVNHRDVAVRLVTPEVAILNGLSDIEVKVGEQDLKMTVRFTILYVQRKGEWLFEAWQSSRLP
ncbi:MAG: nuclear transport factor 2 family protein [Vicinamibacterales bacterium]